MNRSCLTQRGLVLLLVVSTLCPALYAGFKPEQHVIVQSETNGPTSVHAADLDGDGDLDVLSASYWDDKIAWYANDGTGRFGPQQVITATADWARCVYAADLDGDGDLDVLSASSPFWTGDGLSDSKIAWYANDGKGQFRPQQVITTEARGADSVHAADLDGDGDLDVLSASWDDDEIAWYENDGSGHFGPHQVITTEADGTTCVYAADVDGDGDVDVLSGLCFDVSPFYSVYKIVWYANNGSGHFGTGEVITTEYLEPLSLYATDLDADGDLDVLSASYYDPPIWTDTYGAPAAAESKIAWYANDGSGHFGNQQVITTAVDFPRSVYATDLDGDGDLDVLSASSEDDQIAWCENYGSGRFGSQRGITAEADGAQSVYAADLDGDGDLDVLSASYWDDQIAWYANDGTGRFGPQQVITATADWARCVYAADLDGDGDLDVLSASSPFWTGDGLSDSKIAWYANDGKGQFGPPEVITPAADEAEFLYAADEAKSVYAADLDGDGDLDVLSASSVDDKIAWYANDGTGHFGTEQVITTEAHGADSVHAADLDGDGDLDALSASGDDNTIAWYANDGKGQFGPQQVITTAAAWAQSVYAADLDGDGDLDVLSASSYTIAWYANDGKGQFGPQQVITTAAAGAQSVYAADLDGDGDLDVLSASEEDNKIAWYANDGTGHFGPQQVITTAAIEARCVYSADLDSDGDLDVLSASACGIAWYENE